MGHLAEQYQCNLADTCQNMLLASNSSRPSIEQLFNLSIQHTKQLVVLHSIPSQKRNQNKHPLILQNLLHKKNHKLLQEVKNMIPCMLAYYERKYALQMAICKLSTFQRIVTCIPSYARDPRLC